MVIGEAIGSTDVAIIGAGPGGYTAAIKCAQFGKKVTIIDRESVGGICLHHGCIPSKALIHAAEMFHEAKKANAYGLHVGDISLDFSKTQAWKKELIKKLDSGVRALMKHYNIQVLHAEALFESSNKLMIKPLSEGIDINALEFKQCIVATGSTERTIPSINVDGTTVITSTHALELEKAPESILVIGGGYIGIELSQMFAKIGTKVTVVEAMPRILSLIDKEFGDIVARKLKEINGEVFTNAKVTNVEVANGRAKTTFTLEDGSTKTVETEKVLVAIGRTPNTGTLQLENTKVELDDHGFIKVDKSTKTSDPRIFAIGDVAGGVMLAHKAAFEAKIVAEVISGKTSEFDNVIPYAIFSDPEIAGVGMTEDEAKKQGISYTTKVFKSSFLGKARIIEEQGTFFKVILDEEQTILGIHIAGSRASDMIGEAVLAMEMGATIEDLSLIIHPHPTLVEGYGELADLALGFPTNSL